MHTQAVERQYFDVKSCYRHSQGSIQVLQSHLYEISWLKARQEDPNGILSAFWSTVNILYDVGSK